MAIPAASMPPARSALALCASLCLCFLRMLAGSDTQLSIAASVPLHQEGGDAESRSQSPAVAARGPQHGRGGFICRAVTGDAGGMHGAEGPHGAEQQSVQEALSAAEAALADAQEKLADVESLPSARESWQSRVRGPGICLVAVLGSQWAALPTAHGVEW